MYDEFINSAEFTKKRIMYDPVATKRPEAPVGSQGSGGSIGVSSTAKILNRILDLSNRVTEDPREALLKYAKKAEDNPQWSTPAYQHSDPSIFKRHQVTNEDIVEEENEDDNSESFDSKNKKLKK